MNFIDSLPFSWTEVFIISGMIIVMVLIYFMDD